VTEYCVDASIAVKWAVKDEPLRDKVLAILAHAASQGIRLIAPPHFLSEVDSAIRKRVSDGRMSATEGHKAYAILDAAPVQIVNLLGARQRAREIAEQFNQKIVYDAGYAALAELCGCEFWTADKKLYDAVKAKLPFVKYLSEYP
jgi:predicted nucleic acid-binding protein